MLIATTPDCEEAPETLTRCHISTYGWVDLHWSYAAPRESATISVADIRNIGLEYARQEGAAWWLQLDADERLVNGATLRARLLRTWEPFYALPFLQEDGTLLLAPWKLIRTRGRLVCGCHFVEIDDAIWDLSGQGAPEAWRAVLLKGPHVVHEPSLRPPRAVHRLHRTEGLLERRPAHSVLWQLPELPGGTMPVDSTPELDDEQREVIDTRPYYCPACGARYETPGICSGRAEAPHPPEQTEAVADAASEPVEVEGVAQVQQPAVDDETALQHAEAEAASLRDRILRKQSTP